ncbi:class I SAM-dependent methyltransferase [Hyunsoonleella pacifica]|uniref:Class I SAM-dependent methyltransferase n=1 Tax=Hyunsoonleella pacifica TaxID=1080224 RepID=A0A4Q9FSK7_9FLAO|nr:class I SAM-dependent methyltransferase [Hyunsoonleella pacifica]TBN16707.1 class I SAM-dependent methyltransferase [Hyunsoonleella pacifica]GGD17111.1 methyltransferase [Hyunsoonleella pacifica]
MMHIKVKDHSVSGEEFQLIENSKYGFLETTPQPSEKKLPEYYKSEDYISHTDSQRNVFEKVYHLVRTVSLKKKLRLITSFTSEEKKILDVGCGTGDFLQTAKENNWNVFGVEPNAQARRIANKKTNNSVYDIEQLLKFDSNSFDVITLWHVLEHLPNLEDHLTLFKNLLKPKGILIIAVPNYKSYDAKYYKQFWAAYDVPRHLWHFNRNSMSNLVSKFNFQVKKISPMWFDAFYVSMLSEKYKSGKMNPIKGFFVGLLSNIKALGSKEVSSLIYIIKNS